MTPQSGGLTFDALRLANYARLPTFRNKHGQLAHDKADGSDWSPAQWLQAVVGELGEYANIRKKFERGDLNQEEFSREAAKELADVQIYLDILAMQVGVNLGSATLSKFNEVSRRVGSPVFINEDDGSCYTTLKADPFPKSFSEVVRDLHDRKAKE